MKICVRPKMEGESWNNEFVVCNEDGEPLDNVMSFTLSFEATEVAYIELRCLLGETNAEKMAKRLKNQKK